MYTEVLPDIVLLYNIIFFHAQTIIKLGIGTACRYIFIVLKLLEITNTKYSIGHCKTVP